MGGLGTALTKWRATSPESLGGRLKNTLSSRFFWARCHLLYNTGDLFWACWRVR